MDLHEWEHYWSCWHKIDLNRFGIKREEILYTLMGKTVASK